MNTPTISQYAESVCHPYGRFRTLGEPAVERDAYGEPLLYAGGNAAVFKVWLAGRPYALKCYTRPGKRNGMLYAYLAGRRTPLARAFSSEVDTGSREENASNQNHRAPLLIPSEAERL